METYRFVTDTNTGLSKDRRADLETLFPHDSTLPPEKEMAEAHGLVLRVYIAKMERAVQSALPAAPRLEKDVQGRRPSPNQQPMHTPNYPLTGRSVAFWKQASMPYTPAEPPIRPG